jgi:hypothetical protein
MVWFDWDFDRVFDDEELAFSLERHWFDNGVTSLIAQIYVPEHVQYGQTWMRGRLSADGSMLSSGRYHTGEIEDHQFSIIPEPSVLILVGVGLIGIALLHRKRCKAN